MHKSSYLRMKWFKDNFLKDKNSTNLKILDIGAFDVNGSYKPIFNSDNWEYVGMDMEMGPNVGVVVEDCYNWSEIESQSFDVIVSGQAFEHMEFFWLVMKEIERVLKPNGMCCIIAPSTGSEHKYPVDCYRFYTDGMIALAKYVNLEVLHASMGKQCENSNEDVFGDNDAEWKDSILVAQKSGKLICQENLVNLNEMEMLNIIKEQRMVIETLENSTCWKITKPIRIILDTIRRN